MTESEVAAAQRQGDALRTEVADAGAAIGKLNDHYEREKARWMVSSAPIRPPSNAGPLSS